MLHSGTADREDLAVDMNGVFCISERDCWHVLLQSENGQLHTVCLVPSSRYELAQVCENAVLDFGFHHLVWESSCSL